MQIANVAAFLYFRLNIFCVSRIFHRCIFVPYFHAPHFQSPRWFFFFFFFFIFLLLLIKDERLMIDRVVVVVVLV